MRELTDHLDIVRLCVLNIDRCVTRERWCTNEFTPNTTSRISNVTSGVHQIDIEMYAKHEA